MKETAYKSSAILSRIGWAGLLFSLLICDAVGDDSRVRLVPELIVGQVLRYDIRAHIQQHKTTESRVIRNVLPQDVNQDFSEVLQMTTESVGREDGKLLVGATAKFESPEEKSNKPEGKKSLEHLVVFTINGDGKLKNISGLDDLSPIEALAFSSWISKFAFGWTIPERYVKPGEVWKSEEKESTPGPIAKLVWERTTTYGENAKCPVIEKENCSVFLTTAVLKQKSPPENTTPEDFKLHNLKTTGTAKGKNETYHSISTATGLLMRGTEDVQQWMEVVIAKADGTNDVKYTIEVGSHFEVLLVGGAEQ